MNHALIGQWGYRINMLEHMDIDREVMRGGGEFLERFKQRRGRKDDDAVQEIPRTARNNMRPVA